MLRGNVRSSVWHVLNAKRDAPPRHPARRRSREEERQRKRPVLRRSHQQPTPFGGLDVRPAVGPTHAGLATATLLDPPGVRVPAPSRDLAPAANTGNTTARERQLTPGGRGCRRPLAAFLEPAQRPLPAGPTPQRHPPVTPGVGGLHRQGAFNQENANPGGGRCHNAPRGSTSRGRGLLTAVSCKYVAEHKLLSFIAIVPRKAVAVEIRTDKAGVTLINVHGLQAGSSPWARHAAVWATIQMYATAQGLGRRHPVVIAGYTNIYMDTTTNLATGQSALDEKPATSGGPLQVEQRT